MASIALHTDEARKLLRGYVNPKAETYYLGVKKVKKKYLEVHSESYRQKQEVQRHFNKINLSSVIDTELLREDYGNLIEFLEDPMNAEQDMTPRHAEELLQDLLDKTDLYFTCLVTDEAESRIMEGSN